MLPAHRQSDSPSGWKDSLIFWYHENESLLRSSLLWRGKYWTRTPLDCNLRTEKEFTIKIYRWQMFQIMYSQWDDVSGLKIKFFFYKGRVFQNHGSSHFEITWSAKYCSLISTLSGTFKCIIKYSYVINRLGCSTISVVSQNVFFSVIWCIHTLGWQYNVRPCVKSECKKIKNYLK